MCGPPCIPPGLPVCSWSLWVSLQHQFFPPSVEISSVAAVDPIYSFNKTWGPPDSSHPSLHPETQLHAGPHLLFRVLQLETPSSELRDTSTSQASLPTQAPEFQLCRIPYPVFEVLRMSTSSFHSFSSGKVDASWNFSFITWNSLLVSSVAWLVTLHLIILLYLNSFSNNWFIFCLLTGPWLIEGKGEWEGGREKEKTLTPFPSSKTGGQPARPEFREEKVSGEKSSTFKLKA